MNGHHKSLVAVGILLCLMPFIAIPYAWKGILAAVCGALILLCALMLSRKKPASDITE